jgi:hypothetical protein
VKLSTTGIAITASASEVWDVLVDFDAFGEWNPFIAPLHGRPRVGSRLEMTLRPPGRAPSSFRPEITLLREHHELRWEGSTLPRTLFYAEHSFTLEPCDHHRVLFRQRARHEGMLLHWMEDGLRDMRLGFEHMALALKKRVEEQVAWMHDQSMQRDTGT